MTALLSSASGGLLEDVERLRADFPILARTVRGGKPLVYLDSGATSQKPRQVLDAERDFYEQHNAAPHRGAHQLAEEATEAYEGGPRAHRRLRRRRPAGARLHQERHRGAQPGRVRLQQRRHRGRLRGAVPDRPRRRGRRHRDGAPRQPGALAGAVPAHRRDAALVRRHRRGPPRAGRPRRPGQRAHQGRRAHPPVQRARHRQPAGADHRAGPAPSAPSWCSTPASRCRTCRSTSPALGVDFVAFSGHKMLGPTGIGVLWGRRELLAAMPPFITGGSMIETVRMEGSTWAPPPAAVRGRRPDGGPGGRPGGGRRLPAGRRHGPHPRPRDRPDRTGAGGPGRDPRGARHRPAGQRRPGRGGLVRRRRHPPARRRAGARRPRRRGPGRAPLRLAVDAPLRGAGHDAGDVRPLHDARRDRGAGRRGRAMPSGSSGWRDAAGVDVPGDHPGSLPAPARPRAARAVRRRGPPREPDLRRRGDPARAARRTESSPRSPTTARAARSARRARR